MSQAVETILQHQREKAAAVERVKLSQDQIKHHDRMIKVISDDLTAPEKKALEAATKAPSAPTLPQSRAPFSVEFGPKDPPGTLTPAGPEKPPSKTKK